MLNKAIKIKFKTALLSFIKICEINIYFYLSQKLKKKDKAFFKILKNNIKKKLTNNSFFTSTKILIFSKNS